MWLSWLLMLYNSAAFTAKHKLSNKSSDGHGENLIWMDGGCRRLVGMPRLLQVAVTFIKYSCTNFAIQDFAMGNGRLDLDGRRRGWRLVGMPPVASGSHNYQSILTPTLQYK
jgi:hypothetical protein